LNLLILAAGPAAAAAAGAAAATPPPAPAGDGLTGLYLLVGAAVVTQLIGAVVGFVKWLGSRTVDREDKDKQKTEERLDEHDDKFDEQSDALAGIDKSVGNVQTEMKQVLSAIEAMKGTVSEIRQAVDQRIEKQGEYYRQREKESKDASDKKLQELEYKLRQDMMRSINDSIQMSVQQLEERLARKKR
jgi:septal ring factor EnvC (AmiA/AmiB activator)